MLECIKICGNFSKNYKCATTFVEVGVVECLIKIMKSKLFHLFTKFPIKAVWFCFVIKLCKSTRERSDYSNIVT